MAADGRGSNRSARAEDVASIDAIISALYASISGPKGDRDWDRMRSLFLSGARLIPSGDRPNGDKGLQVLTVDEFVATAKAFVAENGFFESEIARTTEQFGNIAHSFSTYESRWTESDPEPFMRGINSIQLLNHEDRWWVVTIFWDNEGPANPIPAPYLPS